MVGWNFRPLRPRSAHRRISVSAASSWGSTEPNPMRTPGNLDSSEASQSLPIHPRPVTDSSSQSRTTPRMSRSAYSAATSSMRLRGTLARKYASVASRWGPIDCCSHSSVGRWTWRSMARKECLLAVVVETPAGLPPQVPGRHHALHQGGRGVDRVLELVVQDAGDVQRGIEPDEVQQRERAHRVGQAELDRGVDVLLAGDAVVQHLHGAVQVRDQQEVHDEPGPVLRQHGGLADPLPVGPGELDRLVRGLEAPNHLEELEHRSEEHTSELQSHHDIVCRLLLEKK